MPKSRKTLDHQGPTQRNLWEQAEAVAKKVKEINTPSNEGTANIRDALRLALTNALKKSPLSRHQVAGEMSHLLSCSITKFMLDTWTCESKENHRFPAEYLPAFCKVTGDRSPLIVLAEASDWFAMPGPDALRSQMQKLDERAREIREKKKELKLLINQVEKR